jgi:hypothetical protein
VDGARAAATAARGIIDSGHSESSRSDATKEGLIRDFPDDLALTTAASDLQAMQTILPGFGCSASELQLKRIAAQTQGNRI